MRSEAPWPQTQPYQSDFEGSAAAVGDVHYFQGVALYSPHPDPIEIMTFLSLLLQAVSGNLRTKQLVHFHVLAGNQDPLFC